MLHTALEPQKYQGKVIKGFGRGSKDLGCPTANIPVDNYKQVLEEIPMGVYWGLASVANGPVYGMALNVGWSPYYQNKEKTIEMHLLNEFDADFYGEEIRSVALGYIRPEANFNGLDELKQAIADDVAFAREQLSSEAAIQWKNSDFLMWK